MKTKPKKLDTLTKEELIEEYNKLSDVCIQAIKEHHKTAEKYTEQVKETAILAMEFKKFKQEMNEIESTFVPTGDVVEEQKNLIEQSEKRLAHLEEIIKNVQAT